MPHLRGRRIEPGDSLTFLIENGSPDGMFVELMRTIVFGEPTKELIRACEQAAAVQKHTFSLMRPGVACADIYASYRQYMAEHGLAPDTRLYSHGQGHDLVERPLIRDDENMVLRAGMNMTAHPSVSTDTVYSIICDNVIVRDQGVEPLHTTEKRIFQARG